MTNEATRLAEEAKRLVVAALNIAESTMPPFFGVTPGQQAICAALDAIDQLATLAQPAVSEDAQSIPLGAIRAIAVESIREVTGCPDILSGDKSLVGALEEVAKAACTTFAAMASQEKPHD